MTVGTDSRPGTWAGEEPAWGRDGTRPEDHDQGKPGDHDQGTPGGSCEVKPEKRGHVWSTVFALGIASAAFLTAWGLHGNSSSTYRIDSHWGAFTGLFILA